MKNIDLLKVDVEGAEIDILMSIDKMFMDKISQISVEFHEKQFDTLKEISRIYSPFSCSRSSYAQTRVSRV